MDGSNDLLISEVLDIETGEIVLAHTLLHRDMEFIFQLRAELERVMQKGTKKLVCPLCGQNLKLRAIKSKSRQIHFAHMRDSEECPIKTNTGLSKEEILSIKYHGCKESNRHISMKDAISKALFADDRFSNTTVEKVVHDLQERRIWKKPDIRTHFKGSPIVFEIQLSTTFLSVIIKRSLFYQENNMPLLWIFDSFDPGNERFTDRDIFYQNNSNAFVFDEECLDKSLCKGRLHLRAYYQATSYCGGKIQSSWKNAVVDFSEISLKDDMAFYHDSSRDKKKARYFQHLDELWKFLSRHPRQRCNYEELKQILDAFAEFGLEVWDSKDYRVVYLMLATLFSIMKGEVFGYRQEKVISLVCTIFESHIDLFWMIVEYIDRGGYESVFANEGTLSTYHTKKKQWLTTSSSRNEIYARYFHYLFPTLHLNAKV